MAELFWLVGADVPQSFAKWREPERIVALATVVVMQRTAEVPNLSVMPGTPQLLATRRIDISSTEIRARVNAGQVDPWFRAGAGADYILSERLYR